MIRAKHYMVTKYWLEYYATDHCTLCGNTGCICPEGQAMRKLEKPK